MINEEYILLTQYIDEINMQNIGPTKFCQEPENSHKRNRNKSFKKNYMYIYHTWQDNFIVSSHVKCCQTRCQFISKEFLNASSRQIMDVVHSHFKANISQTVTT